MDPKEDTFKAYNGKSISQYIEIILQKLMDYVVKNSESLSHENQTQSISEVLLQLHQDIKTRIELNYVRTDLFNTFLHPQLTDIITKQIVKHPSEWYYQYNEPIWEKTDESIKKTDKPFAEGKGKLIEQLIWMKQVPAFNTLKDLWHLNPIQFLEQLATTNVSSDIIFPLKIKPQNDDPKHAYYWAFELAEYHKPGIKSISGHGPAFGNLRSNGARTHAARDLYTDALTDVISIANGVVLGVFPFYFASYDVVILHTLSDGEQFIIRYGELDPQSISVTTGEKIQQGTVLGKPGLLVGDKGKIESPSRKWLDENDSSPQYMLHLEYYTGSAGLNLDTALTQKGKIDNSGRTKFHGAKFGRREDLADPLEILKIGYDATFNKKVMAINNGNQPENIKENFTNDDFFEYVKEHALINEAKTGIPYQIVVAQAILESGWGKIHILTHKSN